MKIQIICVSLILLLLSCTDKKEPNKNAILGVLAILSQGVIPPGDGGTTGGNDAGNGNTGTTNSAVIFPSAQEFTKVVEDNNFVIFGAAGTGTGTLIQFSGHKHELDSTKLGVEPIALMNYNRNKSKFSRFIYVTYAMGIDVNTRFGKFKDTLLQLSSGEVTLISLSAGSLYMELTKDMLLSKNIHVKKTISVAGIKKGILLIGYETLTSQFKDAADVIRTIAPELENYLPESPFIQNLQGTIQRNAASSDFCIAMDFFNSGNDLVTTVESACEGVGIQNRLRLAGDHDINLNQYSLESVSVAIQYILETEAIPSATIPFPSLPLTWDSGSNQFVSAVVPSLKDTSVKATLVNNVPGFAIEVRNGDWEINLNAKLATINFEKNLISLSGNTTAKNKVTQSYFFSQTIGGEVVYNMDYYQLAGRTPRASGFETYPIYMTSQANLSQQAPISWISTMDVSAPVHFYGSYIGIKDHKNFRVRADISGHWYKREQFIFVTVERTIDVRTNNLNIVYTNGIPSIIGSLRLDGWGLGIDNIDTDCTFVEVARTETYVKFSSPQQIRADLIGIPIAQTSCSAFVGGDITLQIIK
ncbi:MAG: hypothetical protein KBA66_12675 [Leptospiraceae bacterium]|nr:hypothetical protein [Leptospiraceae bacterium]